MRAWRKAAAVLCTAALLALSACAYRGYGLLPSTAPPTVTQYPFLGMDLPVMPDEIEFTYWLTIPEETNTAATVTDGRPVVTYPVPPDYTMPPWSTAVETAAPQEPTAAPQAPPQGARLSRGIGIAPRIIADVYRYLEEHPWITSPSYEERPHVGAPYVLGKLHPFTRQGALNHVNCIRYVAGLPEVAWDAAKEEDAQAGAVILARNKVLTHTPARPADMPEELYRMAYNACKSSNIANAGRSNTLHHAITMFLGDSDPANLPELAHRRWMLNPAMGKTAFGLAETYVAMTALDHSAPGGAAYDVVMYPAQVQPVSLFREDWAWTVSFAQGFNINGPIKVILVRRGDSRGWELGRDGALIRSTHGYGQPNCLIFRPDGFSFAAGDIVDVQIEGVTRGGQAHLVQYTVQFI